MQSKTSSPEDSMNESNDESILGDSINRVTVYRLKKALSTTAGQYIDNYYEAFTNDEFGSDSLGIKYSLYFQAQDIKDPKWLDLFNRLALKYPESEGHDKPQVAQSGYILLVNIVGTTYACTGGSGHFKMQDILDIEPRFGIEVAKRILKPGELRSLSQKDTTSFVHSLERAFRSQYQPKNDTDNLHRILTSLRGRLEKSREKERREIGTSLKASDSLSVAGKKNLDAIFEFLQMVDKLLSTQPSSQETTLDVPELSWINPKKEISKIESLLQSLCNTLIDIYKGNVTEYNLFIDSEDIGFLPEATEKFEVLFGRQSFDCGNDYEVALKKIGELLSISPETAKDLSRIRIAIFCIDDDKPFIKHVLPLICGDIEYDNDTYFINNGRWYCANQGFKDVLDREINEIATIAPEEIELLEWSGDEVEETYNARHTGANIVILDRKLIQVKGEKGPIEFCDLFVVKNGIYNLIHVKHASGAALRALFAQAYVALKLYNDEAEFRQNAQTCQVTKRNTLSQNDLDLLSSLKGKRKRNIRVVMAIYDDNITHSTNTAAPQQDIASIFSKTLTLFAKVDLLQRCQSLRSMGYDVALTRIKPYPVKK